LDQVFRRYQPASPSGMEFGVGLTPFAIICGGHKEMAAVRATIQKATFVEGGASISLADASALVRSDVRMPTDTQVAVDKLYGWSLVIDVFHGPNHPVAKTVRDCARELGPKMSRLRSTYSYSEEVCMNSIHRILYELQQDYFSYIRRLLVPNATPPTVPSFLRIMEAVSSGRVSSLSHVPDTWVLYGALAQNPFGALTVSGSSPSPAAKVATTTSAPAPVSRSNPAGPTLPAINPHVDPGLLKRRNASGYKSLTTMMEGHQVVCPQIGGKDVCLSWALNGQCNPGCKRKDMHKKYGRNVVVALHAFLDSCGVAPTQA